MKIDVFDLTGKKVEELTLKKEIFAVKINDDLMAQAVRVSRSNQRAASAKALGRGEISRTTKKVYRQKGTGGARHGSRRAPIYVGGGKALGPQREQNWKLSLSKKMKQAAIKSALSLLAKDKKIIVIKDLNTIKEPKTKIVSSLLNKIFEAKDLRNVAIILNSDMTNAVKSVKNINYATTYYANDLTALQVLSSKQLVFGFEAFKNLETRFKN